MRYALTGATGFIGGALAKQLRDAGHDVVALVRDPARAGQLSDLGVELVPGDLDDKEALDRLCQGARRAEVPRVVYTSTLAVNSDTRGEVVDESYRFAVRHLSVYDETMWTTLPRDTGSPWMSERPGPSTCWPDPVHRSPTDSRKLPSWQGPSARSGYRTRQSQ